MFDTNGPTPPDVQGTEADDTNLIIARGRINNAKKLFEARGWKVLPANERGLRILKWLCDQVWLAAPERWRVVRVRRACLRWAPWLTREELAEMVERTKTSNKRWTHDQSAIVLKLSLDDNWKHDFRFLGACDDLNRDRRDERAREKGVARSRKHRAEHRTGKPPGRPGLNLTKEEKIVRKRKQSVESSQRHRAANSSGANRGRPKAVVPAWQAAGFNSKRSYQRHKARGLTANGTKNACSKNASRSLRKKRGSVTDLSVTDFRCHPTPIWVGTMPSDLKTLIRINSAISIQLAGIGALRL